jgi:hypothetical protein
VLFAVTAFAAGAIHAKAVMPLLFLMGAAALAGGAAAPGTAFPAAAGPLRSVGLLVVLGCSYLLSFKDLVGMLHKVDFSKPGIVIYFAAAGLALAGAAALLARGRSRLDAYRGWQLGLAALGVAIVLAGMFALDRGGGWLTLISFNVIVLGFAVLLILEGSAQLRPKLVGVGCLLFAMIAIGRYADLFTSLLVRAAVFVALGVALFLVGNFYARSRRRAQGAQP